MTASPDRALRQLALAPPPDPEPAADPRFTRAVLARLPTRRPAATPVRWPWLIAAAVLIAGAWPWEWGSIAGGITMEGDDLLALGECTLLAILAALALPVLRARPVPVASC